jgi:hypothetical protein
MAIKRKQRLQEYENGRIRLKSLKRQKLYEKMKEDFDKRMGDIDA